jgi:hypothetical protein
LSQLVWDKRDERTYETGTDHGVLYFPNENGEYVGGTAWNGLISVSKNPSGAEPQALWADNIKYLNLMSAEDFGATIEAYSYPKAFRPCLGQGVPVPGLILGQQTRKPFGFCFRTIKGNGIDGNDWSYLIHIIYGCLASPSERNYSTVNDSPEAIQLSWEITTTPVKVDGYKATSEMIFDGGVFKRKGIMNAMHAYERILYGTDETEARLPSIQEIRDIYQYERYLIDSDGEQILDSDGHPIAGSVYD